MPALWSLAMAGTLRMFSVWWSTGTHNCSPKVRGTAWSWSASMICLRPQIYHGDCTMTSSQGSSAGRRCQPGLAIQFDAPLVASGSTALLFGIILPVWLCLTWLPGGQQRPTDLISVMPKAEWRDHGNKTNSKCGKFVTVRVQVRKH